MFQFTDYKQRCCRENIRQFSTKWGLYSIMSRNDRLTAANEPSSQPMRQHGTLVLLSQKQRRMVFSFDITSYPGSPRWEAHRRRANKLMVSLQKQHRTWVSHFARGTRTPRPTPKQATGNKVTDQHPTRNWLPVKSQRLLEVRGRCPTHILPAKSFEQHRQNTRNQNAITLMVGPHNSGQSAKDNK